MNDDFEDIQRLIRLKRHESPGEGFTDEFLNRFHRRQREEMLRKSSVDLFLERLAARFDPVLNPRWALAGTAVLLVLVGAWFYLADGPTVPSGTITKTAPGSQGTRPASSPGGDPNRPKFNSNTIPASHSAKPEDLPDEEPDKNEPAAQKKQQ